MTHSAGKTLATDGRAFRRDLFAGSHVLITGAGGGMGRAAARAFGRSGASLVLTDSDGAALDRALRESNGAANCGVVADLSTPQGLADVFGAVDRAGDLDIAVSCAAIMSSKRALDVTWEDWERVLRINLIATFFTVQEAYRRMLPRRSGSIVVVASDAGKRGGGGLIADGVYAASKAGVLSLVKSFAREFAKSGVRINALTPGPTQGGMLQIGSELQNRIVAGLPIGRMGRPEDMADAMVFLASPASAFVYGASLNVDGGALFE
jgi:3-oxoacyl-[acyl-carrier protein] reductase